MAEKYKLERIYRGENIYNNSHCLYVVLGNRHRYFHGDGSLVSRLNRCMKEIDDYLAGDIV